MSPLCRGAWLLRLIPLMLFGELALGSQCWLGSRCRGLGVPECLPQGDHSHLTGVGVWMLSSVASRANSKRQLMF